jgi:hypothetical protein
VGSPVGAPPPRGGGPGRRPVGTATWRVLTVEESSKHAGGDAIRQVSTPAGATVNNRPRPRAEKHHLIGAIMGGSGWTGGMGGEPGGGHPLARRAGRPPGPGGGPPGRMRKARPCGARAGPGESEPTRNIGTAGPARPAFPGPRRGAGPGPAPRRLGPGPRRSSPGRRAVGPGPGPGLGPPAGAPDQQDPPAPPRLERVPLLGRQRLQEPQRLELLQRRPAGTASARSADTSGSGRRARRPASAGRTPAAGGGRTACPGTGTGAWSSAAAGSGRTPGRAA